MESKVLKYNIIITMSMIAVVICTLLFTIRGEELIVNTDEEEKLIKTVGSTSVTTPTNLSNDNEREDICKWAKAQVGIVESGSPQTPFHSYFGKTTEAWCQMFVSWTSCMVPTITDSNFSRKDEYGNYSFACVTCYDGYANLNGVNRQTTSTSGLEKGWVRYEYNSSKGNHSALFVGDSQYCHGNWSDSVCLTASGSMGTLKGFGKPYYRSKVYYNTNQSGASYNGYVYPDEYSSWYTEEQEYPLATSGPTCSGKTFQGWYEESACTTRLTVLDTATRGAIHVYAKWSGGDNGGNTTSTPTDTPTITDSPTGEPDVEWSIIHIINGGYFTGSYPTSYKQGYGCVVPDNNAERTGYTFEGWYDYSIESYRTRVYATDIGDKYLYAQWTPHQYPLYLYTEVGKVTTSGYDFSDLGNEYYRYNKYYTYDQVEYLPTQPDGIDRVGYGFGGWYKDPEYTDGPYYELEQGTIGTQVFYAKWTPIRYDLILHKHGGIVVDPVISEGEIIGDDIIGSFTYKEGSVFPKANEDIYKTERVFQGWYENAGMSGVPQTGIEPEDGSVNDIDDEEFWGRWLEIAPNASTNDATEIISNKLTLYIYYTYNISAEEGNVIQRESASVAENKRYFSVDLKADPSTLANSAVKVWVSTDSNPDSTEGVLDNFTITSSKSITGNTGVCRTFDNSTLTFTCPDNIEEFIESDGYSGSRKVYVHVETVTGNRGAYEVNIVKRALYEQQ